MDKRKNNNPTLREVDINEYLPVLIDIIQTGQDVSLLISGNSMSPFLIDKRDTIIISKPDGHFFKGQMIFYQRINGQYIMHRIHHIDQDGHLYLVGDAQTLIEGPIMIKQVFGVIKNVRRKGKLIGQGNFWWEFFEHVWIRIVPIRRLCLKIYSLLKVFWKSK